MFKNTINTSLLSKKKPHITLLRFLKKCTWRNHFLILKLQWLEQLIFSSLDCLSVDCLEQQPFLKDYFCCWFHNDFLTRNISRIHIPVLSLEKHRFNFSSIFLDFSSRLLNLTSDFWAKFFWFLVCQLVLEPWT